jgi:hypothetical protein
MISGILGQVTGQLEKRFILNALFPTLVFALLLCLSVAAGANGGVAGGLELWEAQSGSTQVLLAIGSITAVFVLANLIANGTLGITRIFEGYAFGRAFPARWGRNYHHWHATKLASDPDRYQKRYPVWPRTLTPDRFAPTRLGNVLRSAESYSMQRYGLDSVRLWPRLYHLIPAELRASMEEARASMEFLLVIAFLGVLYVPLASVYLLVVAGPEVWFFADLLGGATVAFVAYWGALTPAAVYGNHVRAAVDLNRFALLEGVNAPIPATPDEERRTWTEVTRWLDLGDEPTFRFVLKPGK